MEFLPLKEPNYKSNLLIETISGSKLCYQRMNSSTYNLQLNDKLFSTEKIWASLFEGDEYSLLNYKCSLTSWILAEIHSSRQRDKSPELRTKSHISRRTKPCEWRHTKKGEI